MKRIGICLALTLLPELAHAVADDLAIPECRADDLLGYVPSRQQIDTHRIGPVPAIEYPEGTAPGDYWGFRVDLGIDTSGAVSCYQLKPGFGESIGMNGERHAWLSGLGQLRYRPFAISGTERAAIVTETVKEIERPARTLALPTVPLHLVRMKLTRSGCYGSCPSYEVTVSGDGQVTYVGDYYVDVQGTHQFQIPIAAVAQLLDSVRDKDLWSAKPEYRAPVTDNPTFTLTLQMGEDTHTIVDYVGEMVGMPPAIREFEREIDEVAGTGSWISLGTAAVDALDAEGFDFSSVEAGALLWRAVSNRAGSDDRAVLRLLQLGVRADVAPPKVEPMGEYSSLLEVALANHRVEIAAALIDAHALETSGQLDQALVDSAFRAAIRGGRLAAAQKVWSAAGDAHRPALTFSDTGERGGRAVRLAPVTLLLRAPYDDPAWEGLQLVQWLAELGCDLHAAGADGRTLLHIAADGNNPEFVVYLLDHDLDVNAPGEFGHPALGSTRNEDIAMLLLDAGTDVSKMRLDSSFSEFARYNHWKRVITWLDMHADP